METMDTNDEICGHHDDANGADDSGKSKQTIF